MVKKDKLLKIKDIRIKASDIKEYEILKYQEDGYFPDEYGKYHCKLVGDSNKYYKYKGFEELKCKKGNSYIYLQYPEEEFKNSFIPLTNRDLIDDLAGLFYLQDYRSYKWQNYNEYSLTPLTKKSELLNFKVCKRDCYTIKIQTYTSGEKNIHFINHDGELNKKEAYKWLEYIDNEMDSL